MTRALVALLALPGVVATAVAQSPPPAASWSPAPADAARLEALSPERPNEYLLLAEELADAAGTDDDAIELARQLYARAFILQAAAGPAARRDAGALLGLAALERREPTQRWLRALAASVDRRYTLFDWNIAAAPAVSQEVAYRAATVLGLARAGEGRDARRSLAEPGVKDLLVRFERVIGTTGERGAISRLEQYISQWPCSECGNARFVTKPTPKGPEIRICPVCRGNPGPTLSREEFLAQLRFESLLLSGIQQSWAAQSIADQAAPLRDPEADDLAGIFGVDASKAVWRSGRWVTPEEAGLPPLPRLPSPPAPKVRPDTLPAPQAPPATPPEKAN